MIPMGLLTLIMTIVSSLDLDSLISLSNLQLAVLPCASAWQL